MNPFIKNLVVGAVLVSVPVMAHSATSEAVLPKRLGEEAEVLEVHFATLFADHLGPGDTLTFIDGRSGHRIAHFNIPADNERYTNRNYKIRQFSDELTKVTERFQKLAAPSRSGNGESLDLLRVFRASEVQHMMADEDRHVLLVGAPVQEMPDPFFSMVGEAGQLQVPTDGHITASIRETPFGLTQQTKGLEGLVVHVCPTDRPSRTELEDRMLMRFWNLWLDARGGTLATWVDDLSVCLERFEKRLNRRLEVAALDTAHPIGLLTAERQLHAEMDATKTEMPNIVKGGPEVVNLFAKADHPTVEGLVVYTGVEYRLEEWPNVYTNAWCYFNIVSNDGLKIRFDIGDKWPGEEIQWDRPVEESLKAAGLSHADFEASRSACRFPADHKA